MPRVDCPHQQPADRQCSGCRLDTQYIELAEHVEVACDGEITARIVRDSDGDGVWATPVLLVEDMELTCGCMLSPAEEQAAINKLAENDSDDLASDLEDEARREAGC